MWIDNDPAIGLWFHDAFCENDPAAPAWRQDLFPFACNGRRLLNLLRLFLVRKPERVSGMPGDVRLGGTRKAFGRQGRAMALACFAEGQKFLEYL